MALDGKFDRQYIHDRAVKKYDMYNVGKKYEYIFKTILNIYDGTNGWYSPNNFMHLLHEYEVGSSNDISNDITI